MREQHTEWGTVPCIKLHVGDNHVRVDELVAAKEQRQVTSRELAQERVQLRRQSQQCATERVRASKGANTTRQP
jgi:hypothetical protein